MSVSLPKAEEYALFPASEIELNSIAGRTAGEHLLLP